MAGTYGIECGMGEIEEVSQGEIVTACADFHEWVSIMDTVEKNKIILRDVIWPGLHFRAITNGSARKDSMRKDQLGGCSYDAGERRQSKCLWKWRQRHRNRWSIYKVQSVRREEGKGGTHECPRLSGCAVAWIISFSELEHQRGTGFGEKMMREVWRVMYFWGPQDMSNKQLYSQVWIYILK